MRRQLQSIVVLWLLLVAGVMLIASNGPARELPFPEDPGPPDATSPAPASPRRVPDDPDDDYETIAYGRTADVEIGTMLICPDPH